MDFDAELMFDCLIYLNIYYFPVFASWEIIMCVTKYLSWSRDTPTIGRDSIVVSIILIAEAIKLAFYKKLREQRKCLSSAICIMLTLITIAGILFTYLFQDPVIKLEYILTIMMLMLAVMEILFGVFQVFPCCKRREYF